MLGPLMGQFTEYRARRGDPGGWRSRGGSRHGRRHDYWWRPLPAVVLCYVFQVRDERLTEVYEYCDTALVERVLALPEG